MLLNKVPLLESKITNLEKINANFIKIDSLRSKQIVMYQNVLNSKESDISQLKNSIKVNKYITGGSILATVILSLLCVLK